MLIMGILFLVQYNISLKTGRGIILDSLPIFFIYIGKIDSFRKIFTYKPIGILVGTTCPWLMRRWKIEFNMVQLSADFFELDEFTSAPPHG